MSELTFTVVLPGARRAKVRARPNDPLARIVQLACANTRHQPGQYGLRSVPVVVIC